MLRMVIRILKEAGTDSAKVEVFDNKLNVTTHEVKAKNIHQAIAQIEHGLKPEVAK